MEGGTPGGWEEGGVVVTVVERDGDGEEDRLKLFLPPEFLRQERR